ncbi:hypothetical protein IEO21_10852 [Rhodonia placenta]|uniref:Uncharacterized protein n=1 Tax=Rhodonia placenta TaxID=104341 RepID=A0A8H7TX17_9APHY|nr:hypothetical protein IEO21_10852 [Postia placenta]
MDLIRATRRVRPASKPSTASLRSSLRNLETSYTVFTRRHRFDKPFDFGYCRRTANRILAKSTLLNRVSSLYDTSKSSAELQSSPLTTHSLRVASTMCRSLLVPSLVFVTFSKGVSRVHSNRGTPCC